MKMSETFVELAAALSKAQAEIGVAIKDSKNPHFNSKYADIASVIDACKPALNKHGIVFLQPVRASEHGVIVDTILMHSSGQWFSEELEIPVSKHDAQGFGSAITYGRRYGLQAFTGVPSEDDDGNAATDAKAGPKITKPIPANAEGKELRAAMDPLVRDGLREHADELQGQQENGVHDADLYLYVERQKFSDEHKMVLWDMLNSKTRSAITRGKASALASQA